MIARRSAACHVTSRRARRFRRFRSSIALTITEGADPGGALFTNGDRQACEASRDVVRHVTIRDHPFVERHAAIALDPPMTSIARFHDDPRLPPRLFLALFFALLCTDATTNGARFSFPFFLATEERPVASILTPTNSL